jgi:hypothetical protein
MTTGWLQDMADLAAGVLVAVLPLMTLFLVFQLLVLRLPRKQVRDILIGTAIAGVGLYLFLLGVQIAFLPFGQIIGERLGALSSPWVMAGLGALLGLTTAWGEPAVRVLADQVEEASHGTIKGRLVLYSISLGVAVWVAIGMLRISYGIPLTWPVVPGYGLAIVMVLICDRKFLGIAIDAGGVATGPLANTFLLAVALGAAQATGQNPLIVGLGFVALIALAPILSVLLLGLVVQFTTRSRE